jgi:hypothetical protein
MVKLSDHAARIGQLSYDAAQRGELAMWTIYNRPRDFPDAFVARLFAVGNGKVTATELLVVLDSLDEMREAFQHAGLTVIPRNTADDPNIVETWL